MMPAGELWPLLTVRIAVDPSSVLAVAAEDLGLFPLNPLSLRSKSKSFALFAFG